MWQSIILLIGVLISLFGVVLIYDARTITNKIFSFGDQNEASLGLKMIGFILCIVGSIIIILNK